MQNVFSLKPSKDEQAKPVSKSSWRPKWTTEQKLNDLLEELKESTGWSMGELFANLLVHPHQGTQSH